MQMIENHTLSNGLQILLRQDHSAPIISHWIWYRVGSRDELAGHTGVSHWVEHMQFKGSLRYPAGILDKAISREGGFWNAFTFLDWTAYFETMPADKIDLALQLEADRMVNSLFDPTEFESERTVIMSERLGNQNEPLFQLGEEVQAAAFRVHSYHHEVIGDLPDLQTIKRDELYNHYRTYYNPNNAVIAIAGDIDPAQMLDRLSELYASVPAGQLTDRLYRPEPEQRGERRVIIEGSGETAYAQAAYKAPAASNPDFFSLMALDSLLSGPNNINLLGEGLSNKTSRLYRALVETELAVGIFGGPQATIDPFLLSITAVVHPESTPEKVISALDEEIYKLQQNPPAESELQRALKQAKALFAYSNESITNQAFWLGFTQMIADESWYEHYLERLENVTPEDVQRAAQTYLRPQNRVLGFYLPSGVEPESEL
jgi:zinc protease